MTIRRGFVKSELPTRPPEGFEADHEGISRSDMDRLIARGAITIRAIEEARWLSTRTDGGTATAPFSNRVDDIADMMCPEDEAGELGPNYWFWSSLVDTTSKVVEGRIVLPESIQDDQIEDWLIYMSLNKMAWAHARWEWMVKRA